MCRLPLASHEKRYPMRIKTQDKSSVAIELTLSDAEHLLSGLSAQGLDLGHVAVSLRDQLLRVGIKPLAKPLHIRTEHVPPSDLMNPHSETGD